MRPRSAAATLLVALLSTGIALSSSVQAENVPYVEHREWRGFLACSANGPFIAFAACSAAQDPNDDFLHESTLAAGARTLLVSMHWQPNGGLSDDRLRILIDIDGEAAADVSGHTPLDVRLDDLPDDAQSLRFRVFSAGEPVGFVYQQPFTVDYEIYYHEPAPPA